MTVRRVIESNNEMESELKDEMGNVLAVRDQPEDLKASVAERISQRMKSSTQEMVQATEARNDPTIEYALKGDPKEDGHLALNESGQLQTVYGDLEEYPDALGRMPAKPGTPLAEIYVREHCANTLIKQWATTSNDSNSVSLALQEAARVEFQLNDASQWQMDSLLRMRVNEEVNRGSKVHRDFIRAQYEETQSMFSRRGISEVVVYRGIETPNRIEDDGQVTSAKVRTRPMSSWSTRASVAESFAEGGRGGIVMRTTIPVEKILSTPLTGVGCRSEAEIVSIGESFEVSAASRGNSDLLKSEITISVDDSDMNADWIKTLAWDLPTDQVAMERQFGPDWRKKFERLPAWQAAPASLRNPAVVKFAPGLTPVLKHPGHPDQKVHAGGRSGMPGMKLENGRLQYGEFNVGLPDTPGDEWRRKEESEISFRQWGGNHNIRVASARMMGITEGFSPKGGRGEEISLTDVSNSLYILEGSKRDLGSTKLYRGIRLVDGDPRLTAKRGDEFEMPLSAFAANPELPRRFARGASGTTVSGSDKPRTSVMITTRGPIRGHESLVPSDFKGGEIIVQGRFRVANNKKTEDGVNLTLEQTAYYDISLGEWVDNA
jgi:hypothetical protein